MAKILVTCAWPYTQAIPHFGNIIPFLSADALARYHRLKGDDVEFVSGSDEHGARMELEARKLGVTPKQLVDSTHEFMLEINKKFRFSFTNYSRTSSSKHKEFVQEFYNKIYDNGHIEIKDEELPYCIKCEMFLPDKFVKGDCPHCGEKDIQGDQCDNCGRVLDAIKLHNPRCFHCETKPMIKKTKTAYFNLPKFTNELKKYVDKQNHWQPRVKHFTQRWFEEGLQKRPVTRDLEWGIPAPFPEMNDKVIYCWAEAVLGYLSTVWMIGRIDEYWKNKKAYSYFCLGKDNITFHTILLPGLLIGHGGYELPSQIVNNEYLNFEGKQFSKTRGIGVYLDDIIDILPPDYWRYYLYRISPENKDTDFSWKDFEVKINNELVANLANFVNRVINLLNKYCDGNIPDSKLDKDIEKQIKEILSKYEDAFKNVKIKDPLDLILQLSSIGNEYLQRKEPWKNEKNKDCLYTCSVICKVLSILLDPYIPESAEKIRKLFGIDEKDLRLDIDINIKGKVGKPEHLFHKINVNEIQEQINDRRVFTSFSKLDLKVAKVIEAVKHPRADNLYVLKVDNGSEERQIVSGLVKHYVPEELVGKKIILLNNLKKADLRGVISSGMLLAASKKDKLGVLFVSDAEIGSRITLSGVESKSNKEVTIGDFAKIELHLKDEMICYKDHILKAGDELVKTEKAPDGARVG